MTRLYRWVCLDIDGTETAPATGSVGSTFPTQADAEGWLAAEWSALADAGVESVTLMCGDEEIYGPMSLRPAK